MNAYQRLILKMCDGRTSSEITQAIGRRGPTQASLRALELKGMVIHWKFGMRVTWRRTLRGDDAIAQQVALAPANTGRWGPGGGGQ